MAQVVIVTLCSSIAKRQLQENGVFLAEHFGESFAVCHRSVGPRGYADDHPFVTPSRQTMWCDVQWWESITKRSNPGVPDP